MNPDKIIHRIAVCAFFAVVLCVGIIIFKDYGISWDEPTQVTTGGVVFNYITKGDQTIFQYQDRYYGPVFEIFLVAVELIFNLTNDLRAVFLMRHLVNFLLFYVGLVFFYKLCGRRFKSWKVALLGSLFLVLSPRIFADAFYNPKDIPFLSLFIISMYTLSVYLDKKTAAAAVLHAMACALLIDVRILGVFMPLCTALFFIADLLIIKTFKTPIKKILGNFLLYFVSLIFLTVAFWPILWKNPIYHFIEAFKHMSHFPVIIGVLYLGNYIDSASLPWHYLPVWIAISTPILYTVCFLAGCFFTIRSLLRKPTRSYYVNARPDLMFFLCAILPLAVVIMMKSAMYDAWRQMFFIYPAFLIIALTGITSVFKAVRAAFKARAGRIISAAIAIVIAFDLARVALTMIRYHPYQNVYFNTLAGRDMAEAKDRFELDYWGLSYRKALEYILKTDKDKVIKVCVINPPGFYNSYLLPPEERQRLKYVERFSEAKYVLGNYRGHKEEYPLKNEYYSIKVNGAKIMVVYKT